MSLGPIEVIVLSFPENRFTGDILPELAKLVAAGTITIVDGLFIRKNDDSTVELFEIDELDSSAELSALGTILTNADGMISDDDVAELAEDLAPGSSAAVLAFEHTWMVPLRDAIVASGGRLVQDIHIPGPVADEVLVAVAELTD